MAQDEISKKVELNWLSAFYGGLLTDKQRQVLTLHCELVEQRGPVFLLSAFFSIHGAAGSPAHAPGLRRKCPPRSLRITSSSRLIMSFGIYSVSAAQMDSRY